MIRRVGFLKSFVILSDRHSTSSYHYTLRKLHESLQQVTGQFYSYAGIQSYCEYRGFEGPVTVYLFPNDINGNRSTHGHLRVYFDQRFAAYPRFKVFYSGQFRIETYDAYFLQAATCGTYLHVFLYYRATSIQSLLVFWITYDLLDENYVRVAYCYVDGPVVGIDYLRAPVFVTEDSVIFDRMHNDTLEAYRVSNLTVEPVPFLKFADSDEPPKTFYACPLSFQINRDSPGPYRLVRALDSGVLFSSSGGRYDPWRFMLYYIPYTVYIQSVSRPIDIRHYLVYEGRIPRQLGISAYPRALRSGDGALVYFMGESESPYIWFWFSEKHPENRIMIEDWANFKLFRLPPYKAMGAVSVDNILEVVKHDSFDADGLIL